MPIWRFCNGSPRTQGGGGLSKSTLLITLGTLTRPQCAGITPDPVCMPTIAIASMLSPSLNVKLYSLSLEPKP